MTRGQLAASMGRDELAEWMAFDQLEPFGQPAEARYFATIYRLVAALFGGSKGGQKHREDNEIFGFAVGPRKKATTGAMMAKCKGIAAAFAARSRKGQHVAERRQPENPTQRVNGEPRVGPPTRRGDGQRVRQERRVGGEEK